MLNLKNQQKTLFICSQYLDVPSVLTQSTMHHCLGKKSLVVISIILSIIAIIYVYESTVLLVTLYANRSNQPKNQTESTEAVPPVLPTIIEDVQNANRSIFHLHIQKAGGTAFAAALSSALCRCPADSDRRYTPSECSCPVATALRERTGRTLPLLQSRLTSGWGCGVHAWLWQVSGCKLLGNLTVGGADDDIAIVTVLRDPLQRVLSEYRHCEERLLSAGDRTECWDWSYADRLDVDSYAKLDNSYSFQNRQMKMVSGCSRSTNWTDETVCRECLEAAKVNVREICLGWPPRGAPLFCGYHRYHGGTEPHVSSRGCSQV
eukprot:GHVN01007570.1.p1 GENE.GHVN01007570.1~~GHVN01007570.1.p1  ORF type:complete len:320 (-),score=-6.18 GHVN01007570.1:190-1149(-)